jgi:hypothetical protein
MSPNNAEDDSAMKTRLRIVALLVIGNFLQAGGWAVLSGSFGWNVPSFLLLLLMPFALKSIWTIRAQLNEKDWRIVYWTFSTWLLVSLVVKLLFWEIAGGRPYWGAYGADKGFANVLVVEPSIVGTLCLVYFVALRYSGERLSKRILRGTLVASAALVAILVPPLGE